MGVFSRSWEITKLSFSVMKKEKELFVFPILSIIFSILFVIAIFFPTVILGLIGGSFAWGVLEYVLVFVTYFGLAFIATFFNVCVVYTSALAFNNQEARFGGAIKFAIKRVHVIFLWSIVSASVGLLLKIIEDIANKIKGLGGIILHILRSIIGMAWNIVTIFVIPGLVYHNLGPFAAIKKSVEVLRKTWGETLVRVLGMGFAVFIFVLLGFFIGVPLIVVSFIYLGMIAGIIILFLVFIYFITIIIMFGVANQVFNTALYVYAETGIVPGPYSKEIMQGAFKPKEKKLRII